MEQSTCDLSDKYGDKGRVIPPGLHHFGGVTRFGGAVVTLKCPEDNTRLKELVATPGGGRVLVVDGGGSLRYALLGDLVAKQAEAHGWAGIVVHGCVRDTAVLKQLKLGVVALAAMPRRSLKNGEGTVGIAVEIAGVRCAPGDWLFADEDGIFVIDEAALSQEEKA